MSTGWIARLTGFATLGCVLAGCARTGLAPGDGSSEAPAPAATPAQNTGCAVSLLSGGLGGSGYVDGVGPTARLQGEGAITSDRAGNLYFAVETTVRKLVVASGEVSTLAGVWLDSRHVDGFGGEARFTSIGNLVNDGAGNLYMIDNRSIRRLSLANNEVTTFPDTLGLVGPTALMSDRHGYLYVLLSGSCELRKVSLASNEVSLVGGGLCGLDLTTDSAGDFYAQDSTIIRKLTLSSGEVSTLAGLATVKRFRDGVAFNGWFRDIRALASDGTLLFLTDVATVREVSTVTRELVTVAGSALEFGHVDGVGADARFAAPSGITSDGAGNLYVLDYTTVRRFVPATGQVSTLAGAASAPGAMDGSASTARFSSPSGLASDEDGNVFVADTENHAIRKVELRSGKVTTVAGALGKAGHSDGVGDAARFTNPWAVAYEGGGELLVLDGFGAHRVHLATGAVSSLSLGDLGEARALDGHGRLYILIEEPAPGATGHVFALDEVDLATGLRRTVASLELPGPMDTDSLVSPLLIADSADYFYISNGFAIYQFARATEEVTLLAGDEEIRAFVDGRGAEARLMGPRALASNGRGSVFFIDGIDNAGAGQPATRLRKLDVASGEVTTLVGSASGDPTTLVGSASSKGVRLGPCRDASLSFAGGLAVLPDGRVAVAASPENSILIVDGLSPR